MKLGHIVTVGTSLVSNDGGNNALRSQTEHRAAVDRLNEICKDGLKDAITGGNVQEQRTRVTKALLALCPKTEFGFRSVHSTTKRPKDRLPQELSYLWKFANGAYDRSQCCKQDMVRLLASDTNDAKNCALIIADVLAQKPWSEWYKVQFNVGADFAKDVDAEKGDLFRDTGIHKWMEKIQEMIKMLENEGCDRIFLNVTGGYKGTVPYSVLMGMLYNDKVELAYLFEESPEIIFIPSYPVGLDFRQWHENALRLRMAKEPIKTTYFIPDKPVGELLQSDRTLSAFGKALEERYEAQLNVDPLKVYSKNIITRLLNEEGPWVGGERPKGAADGQWSDVDKREVSTLRGILHELIDKVGDIIWLGDKIPEMVEHAQRHHHDLLEFTELFLTPILYHEPGFLNARERFVLLAAVMLHDSGHSLDRISVQACQKLSHLFGTIMVNGIGDEIPLFPSDVRDYHQYLAGIRLDDEGMAKDLGWPRGSGFSANGLPESLHDAVILACLYHRRKMDFDQDSGDQAGKLHLTGQWPGPLCEKADKYKQDCGVDLMKVVALLRLIDGCDSQARRAGPRPRIDLSISLLERDYRTAAMRAQQAYEAFCNVEDCTSKKNWQGKIVEETRNQSQGTRSWALNDKGRETRIACLKALHNSTSTPEEKQCARLWLIAAEAADRAQMRFKQFPHFLKHLAIKEIRVLPAKDFYSNNLSFNIILVPESSSEQIPDPYDQSRCFPIREWLDQHLFQDDQGLLESLKKTIEREVSAEYAQMAEYTLRQLKLKVRYWWQDEWDRRENGGQPFFPPL
jgi:hypothetical protein